jgi:hypothetical protein
LEAELCVADLGRYPGRPPRCRRDRNATLTLHGCAAPTRGNLGRKRGVPLEFSELFTAIPASPSVMAKNRKPRRYARGFRRGTEGEGAGGLIPVRLDNALREPRFPARQRNHKNARHGPARCSGANLCPRNTSRGRNLGRARGLCFADRVPSPLCVPCPCGSFPNLAPRVSCGAFFWRGPRAIIYETAVE